MPETKLTEAQRKLLIALDGHALNASTAAEKMGYNGILKQTKGGCGRAPMYFGRILKSMPPGLVESFVIGNSVRYRLTAQGIARAKMEADHGRDR